MKSKQIIAKSGALVVWNGSLWHKTPENKSNEKRYGLFACFANSQFKEVSTEEEHLIILESEEIQSFPVKLRSMLGYERGVKRGAKLKIKF